MTGTWASGWVTGDVGSATEFSKSWGSIFDTTLGGSAASIDITGIVGTYAHLMAVVYARGDAASPATALLCRFNGDTAANYDRELLQGIAAGVSSAEAFAQTTAQIGNMAAGTATANLFAATVMFIPHYAGSSNNKAAVSISAMNTGTTSGSITDSLNGVFWRSNATINRITLIPLAGNFVTGTRVTLYAMGA